MPGQGDLTRTVCDAALFSRDKWYNGFFWQKMVHKVGRKLHQQIIAQDLAGFMADLAIHSDYRRMKTVVGRRIVRTKSFLERTIY